MNFSSKGNPEKEIDCSIMWKVNQTSFESYFSRANRQLEKSQGMQIIKILFFLKKNQVSNFEKVDSLKLFEFLEKIYNRLFLIK